MEKFTILIIATLFPVFTLAQINDLQFNFSGFADTYHAVRSKSPNDYLSSRSRLRTELGVTAGKSFLFASLNTIHNSIVEDQSKTELREAFFQYTNTQWDFKAGRQIIIWGNSDAMRITDIISPMDYSEFLARDYDDIRMPINAFRLKYIKPDFNIEIVFIPVPEFFILPTDAANPWCIINNFDQPVLINEKQKPEKEIENCEFGGRFSFYLSGIDFSFSALHTWNKMPAFQYSSSENGDTLLLAPRHKQMNMLGVTASKPVGQLVIRADAAAYLNELLETGIDSPTSPPVSKNTINALLGIDWYPGNEWTITAQYYLKHISKYEHAISSGENTEYITQGITKKILRGVIKFSTFTYFDMTNQGFFNRSYADYALTDQIHISGGYDWFHGDEGQFSMYQDNSEFWIKGKFSF